jgi:hypothetical protein
MNASSYGSAVALFGMLTTGTACGGGTTTTPPPVVPLPQAAPPSDTHVLTFEVSPENLNVDKVGLRDGYQRPDGNRDLAFHATIDGPFDALFVVSTNQKGEPIYGLRADTLVGNEEIPTELGGAIDTGKMTVGIGVALAGRPRFINGENGSVHLGSGLHELTLYIPNTATLIPGAFVRIYVKAHGEFLPGPIAAY